MIRVQVQTNMFDALLLTRLRWCNMWVILRPYTVQAISGLGKCIQWKSHLQKIQVPESLQYIGLGLRYLYVTDNVKSGIFQHRYQRPTYGT